MLKKAYFEVIKIVKEQMGGSLSSYLLLFKVRITLPQFKNASLIAR